MYLLVLRFQLFVSRIHGSRILARQINSAYGILCRNWIWPCDCHTGRSCCSVHRHLNRRPSSCVRACVRALQYITLSCIQSRCARICFCCVRVCACACEYSTIACYRFTCGHSGRLARSRSKLALTCPPSRSTTHPFLSSAQQRQASEPCCWMSAPGSKHNNVE